MYRLLKTNLIRVCCMTIIVLSFIHPLTAVNCDGPPVGQAFIIQAGGCNQSPAVVPCTDNFLFPAQPSLGGDAATQYYLDFGDGTPPYYGFNDFVSHTYDYPGTYVLKHRAGTACDRWIERDLSYLVAAPPNYTPVLHGCTVTRPQASFSATPLSGIAPFTVQFTSTSTGANDYAWDFGDGGSSPAENPRHTYMSAGLYSVTLVARDICTNAASTATMSHLVTVTVQSGTLALTTTPPNANVFVDNVFKGVTPLTLSDTPSGYHLIRITRPDYDDYTTSATVEPGKTTIVKAELVKSGMNTTPITLPATTVPVQKNGSIAITSVPSGASVILDGQNTGITPVIITDVLPGNHALSLSYPGYSFYNQTISVGSEQTAAFNAVLVVAPKPDTSTGSLSVTTDPPGAQVSIDGDVKGVSPATIPGLSAGTHTLLIKLEDYQDLQMTVNITPGKTQDYTTGLKKVFRPSLVEMGLAMLVILIVIGAGIHLLMRKDEI
jgi:PKD repeat protein